MINLSELESALALTGDLERDLTMHASLYYHVASGVACLDSDVEAAKYGMDQLEATLQGEIRTAATQAGEKVTETLIASRVITSVSYQTQYKEYLNLCRSQMAWKSLQRAYEQRGHVLHDLTLLATRSGDVSGINTYAQLRQASAQKRVQLRK